MSGPIGGNPHFRTGRVSIADTATELVPSDSGRLMLHLTNSGGDAVYIGDETVTSETGYPVLGSSAITVSTRDAVYAITATGVSAAISYFEEYW
ncbi:MAG TPA: hypothetical protein VGK19_21280 [Capsulimonadaceae bacterium]|jgi:hypothetical protein